MWESFFGFKKTPFSDSPDAKQLLGVRDRIPASPENRFPASLLLTQMIISVNRIRIL